MRLCNAVFTNDFIPFAEEQYFPVHDNSQHNAERQGPRWRRVRRAIGMALLPEQIF